MNTVAHCIVSALIAGTTLLVASVSFADGTTEIAPQPIPPDEAPHMSGTCLDKCRATLQTSSSLCAGNAKCLTIAARQYDRCASGCLDDYPSPYAKSISPDVCAAYDENGSGSITISDFVLALATDSNHYVADWIARTTRAGCWPFENGSDEILAHFNFCVAVDANDDHRLSFDDLQIVLSSDVFSVAEKMDAVIAISGGQLGNARCIARDSDALFENLPTLVDAMMDDLSACYEADMNGDGVLDIADYSLVSSRTSGLSAREQARLIQAIESPLCAGGLD